LAVELAVVRIVDADGALVARAVAPPGSPLAAEVTGSRLEPGADPGPDRLLLPARAGGRTVGALELVGELDAQDIVLAELLASHLALALHHLPGGSGLPALRRAGEALAAGA